jgi:hypothetical protein
VAIRRQQTSWRTVEAHHRALDVMGKLAAQQSGAPRPDRPAESDHPYVRVVHDDGPVVAPKPPQLRSRPRRARQLVPPDELPAPGPNTRIVREGEDPSPRAPVVRTVLHFEADAVAPAQPAPGGSWADIPPGRPDQPAPRPPRRRARVRRLPPRITRSWRAAALATAVTVVVVVVVLATNQSGHRRRPPPPQTAANHPAARLTPLTSAAATAAPTPAVLVTDSPGSSTYHVDTSATIRLAARGSCWVEIRQSSPTGPLLYEGDLLAGQTRAVGGPAWVRLGNPTSMVVTVNGTSISPPGLVAGEPYDLQFA